MVDAGREEAAVAAHYMSRSAWTSEDRGSPIEQQGDNTTRIKEDERGMGCVSWAAGELTCWAKGEGVVGRMKPGEVTCLSPKK